jgi:hypothetical protein
VGWLTEGLLTDTPEKNEVTPPSSNAPAADANGVDTLLEIATAAVDDERERGRGLDAKAASLTAFAGLTLSINATLGRPLLDRELGSVGDDLVASAFLLSTVGLLAAVLAALYAVVRPQKYRGLHREQLARFSESEAQAMTKLAVQQAMLGALKDIISQDRPLNDRKAKALKLAGYLIAVGVFGVAGEAVTLALRELGVG